MSKEKNEEKLFVPFMEKWLEIQKIFQEAGLSSLLKKQSESVASNLQGIKEALNAAEEWEEQVNNDFQELVRWANEFLEDPQTTEPLESSLRKILLEIDNEIKKINADPKSSEKSHTDELEEQVRNKFQELALTANFLQEPQTTEPLRSFLIRVSFLANEIQNIGPDPRHPSTSAKGHTGDWEKEAANKFQEISLMVNEFFQDSLQICPRRILKIADKIGEIKVEPRPRSTSSTSSSKGQQNEERETYTNWRKLESDEKILSSPAMADARASYEDLEAQLKLCFLSLSVFPENSEIKKRDVMYWWMGMDLLRETRKDETTTEDIGEDCFSKLVESGLIEPIYRKCSKSVHSCRLHPWVRWMAISIAKETLFFDFNHRGMPTQNCPRSACLATAEEKKQIEISPPPPSDPSELQSLFNINVHYLKCDKEKFSMFKKATILHLGRWQNWLKHHIELENTDFLDGLGLLKGLRYLGLQGISRITELPKSIGKLYNLRILDLRACHNLETLSNEITSLKKLRHLDVSECYLLDHMPKGLGYLSELRVLKGFVIGSSRSKDPCTLNELTKLKNLRKLSMSIGREAVMADEEMNALAQIQSLHSLTITWGTVKLPSSTKEASKNKTPTSRTIKKTLSLTKKPSRKFKGTVSVTSLSLPSNLKKLDLRCFPEEMTPKWLMPDNLKSLKRLYFRGGKLSSLPDKKKDSEARWQVEILRLKFLEELVSEWDELKKVFQNVNLVEIVRCPKITNFIGDKDGLWMKREEASTSNSNSSPAAQNQS